MVVRITVTAVEMADKERKMIVRDRDNVVTAGEITVETAVSASSNDSRRLKVVLMASSRSRKTPVREIARKMIVTIRQVATARVPKKR